MSIDGSRGDAYFNMGVLYKDFRANKTQGDNPNDQVGAIRKSVAVYRQAKEFFNQFLGKQGSDADKTEAKENIKDIDKVTKQLEQFATMLANQPKMPATPPPQPTPAPQGGATPPAGGAAPAGGATPPKK